MFETIIVQPIFNLLIAIYSLIPGGDFGIAIIIFTIIVRFLMYPLVKKQLHQSRMMQKLQPRLKEIKKNAAGNKQLEAMQMMELYKKYGVSPFRSIGILFIQLPIFIGLYNVIQIFTLHRERLADLTYGFLQGFEPIKDIVSNPESFNNTMLGFIDLTRTTFGNHGVDIPLLIIAAIAGVSQYFMMKQTMPSSGPKKTFRQMMAEAAEGKQSDAGDMNTVMMGNMMKIMPVIMFFIMISLPGAIALYYVTQNIIALGQQAYILKGDIGELEDVATEQKQTKVSKKTANRVKNAKNANVTRIVAKDSKKGKK